MGKQVKLKVVKGNLDCHKVISSAGCNGIGPRSVGSEHIIKTSTLW